MSWWGKLVGGYMGFSFGGPLGALLGGAIGHMIDSRLSANGLFRDRTDAGDAETQAAFFTATFSVMGYVAKSDGHVSREEIHLAEQVMTHMNLSDDQRKTAIRLFQQGKAADFDLQAVLSQFSSTCGRRINLKKMFLEIQLQAVYADGVKHPAEDQVLNEICRLLGFPVQLLRQLEAIIRFHYSGSRSSGTGETPPKDELMNAYRLLGMESNAADVDIKKAYRRLMSQHHPDKLVARGLPEEMVAVATEKTKDIQRAYELIKRVRKMK